MEKMRIQTTRPRPALCPVFGACGGCSFQDVPYAEQVEAKKNSILSGFLRQKLTLPAEVNVETGPEYGYRNRMDFVFCPEGLGQKRKQRFDQVVPFESCPISNPVINDAIAEINAWFRTEKKSLDVFRLVERTGTLSYATIRASLFSRDSCVTFILNADSLRVSEHEELIRRFSEKTGIPNILTGYVPQKSSMSITDQYRIVKGRDVLYEVLFDKRFWYHSQGFFQNNSRVTEKMIEFASDCLGDKADVLVDLYGGVGTFGISLHDKASEVVIIENNGKSTDCAAMNLRENALANARIMNHQAEELAVSGLTLGGRSVFVVDPPRPGLHKKTIKFIKASRPERIVYVSCNPAKQAEDIFNLQPEYRMTALRLFDMFPQTPHCESVALLEQNKSS